MANALIPIILKHCVLAIFKSGDLRGKAVERFEQAWKIGRSQLTKYGYLSEGSEEGPVLMIRLTGKGKRREQDHARERGGSRKTSEFDKLYKTLGGGLDIPKETKGTAKDK